MYFNAVPMLCCIPVPLSYGAMHNIGIDTGKGHVHLPAHLSGLLSFGEPSKSFLQ
jgi:hypothetical protein